MVKQLTACSEKLVQDQCLKAFYPLEDRIVCNQTTRLGVKGGRGVEGIRSSQAMGSVETGGKISDLQVGSNPAQVGKSGKEAVELIYPSFVEITIGLNQQLRQGDG